MDKLLKWLLEWATSIKNQKTVEGNSSTIVGDGLEKLIGILTDLQNNKADVKALAELRQEMQNISVRFKGYHTDETALKAAYPPSANKKDDFAWVGTPAPGFVYKVFGDGQSWTKTAEMPDLDIDFGEYVKRTEVEVKANKVNENGESVVYEGGLSHLLKYTISSNLQLLKSKGLFKIAKGGSDNFFKDIKDSRFNSDFIKSLSTVGNKESLKNPDGTFKRLFITWLRRTNAQSKAGLQISEMSADGTVGLNNIEFAIGEGFAVNSTNQTNYPMVLEGVDAGIGLSFDCVLNWRTLSSIPNSIDLNDGIELDTQFLYNGISDMDFLSDLYYVSSQDGIVSQTAWSSDFARVYKRSLFNSIWSDWLIVDGELLDASLFKNIKENKFSSAFIESLKITGDRNVLKNADGTFKRLFISWIRKSGGTSNSSGLQISEMNENGTVGVNNIEFATGMGINVNSSNASHYPMTLEGKGNGAGLIFNCVLEWMALSNLENVVELKDRVELDTKVLYNIVTNDLNLKPLSEKIVVHFGDSISADGVISTLIKKLTGANIYNIAIGGLALSYNQTTSELDRLCISKMIEAVGSGDYSQLQAIATGTNKGVITRLGGINFSKVDIITIFAGVNDYTQASPLGNVTDEQNTTVKGAVNLIFKNIQTKYPHIKIIFITPTRRLNYDTGLDSDTNPNSNNIYLIEYVDAIIKASERNHHRVLDLYRGNCVNKYNHSYYIKDGVHPNEKGYELYASSISAFIISLFKY